MGTTKRLGDLTVTEPFDVESPRRQPRTTLPALMQEVHTFRRFF